MAVSGTPKNNVQDFAVLGGKPYFDRHTLHHQCLPSWAAYEAAMRDIFARQYYTNHGPLVRQLELDLQQFCRVKHAVCVTNGMIGLVMIAEALQLKGKVIVPAFTHIATIEAMLWAGLTPVLCDVDPQSKLITAALVEPLITEEVVAILAVNLWGQVCDVSALEHLAKRYGKVLFMDSAQAFGCQKDGHPIGGYGLAEVFSFSYPSILNATQGGCITTNDDVLAARLRNIRSSYGAGVPVEVVKTSNGRMSEAQAALALTGLSELNQRIQYQAYLYQIYQTHLFDIPGIRLIALSEQSNYQSVVCEIDTYQFGIDRDRLLKILRAENIDVGKSYQWQCSDHLAQYGVVLPTDTSVIRDCTRILTLPIGKNVNEKDVQTICQMIAQIQVMHMSFTLSMGD